MPQFRRPPAQEDSSAEREQDKHRSSADRLKSHGEETIIQNIHHHEVLSAIEHTRELVESGKMKHVPFDHSKQVENVAAEEWNVSRMQSSAHGSVAVISNVFAGSAERVPFSTSEIGDLAANEGTNDFAFVKGHVVARPDKAGHTTLVLACRNHMNLYTLNEEREIESTCVFLGDMGIEKRPEVVVVSADQNTEFGKAIYFGVLDESTYRSYLGHLPISEPRHTGKSPIEEPRAPKAAEAERRKR